MKTAHMIATLATVFMTGLRPAMARTWNVMADGSGDAPNITAAADSARSGDEIVVHAGTYVYKPWMTLKPGTVLRSQAGADQTHLIGSDADSWLIQCYQPGDYRIEGFTFEPGGWPFLTFGSASVPTVRRCIFQGGFSSGRGGGAFACDNGTIEDCVFSNCSAWAQGGALVCRSSRVARCTFTNNGTAEGHGGALYGTDVEVVDCRFLGNAAAPSGTHSNVPAQGGGAYLLGTSVVTSSLFSGNRAFHGFASGSDGAALVASRAVNCVFAGNFGEGASVIAEDVESCTFWGDMVQAQRVSHTLLVIRGACYQQLLLFRNVTCSDIVTMSGTCDEFGPPSFSLDPQFCAVDPGVSLNFQLQSDSPCLPGQHPPGAASCGLIGAHGAGCGVVSIRPKSWSDLRGLYR